MSNNVGPIPKIVVATTLTFGAIGATIGGAIDYLSSEGIHRTWVDESKPHGAWTYDDARRENANAQKEAIEAETNAEANIKDLLDEKCRVAVKPYRIGGEFADVVEEGVIDDLMAEPDLPCQGLRRQIRAIIRRVRYEDSKAQEWRDYAEGTKEELEIFREYDKDDKDFQGFIFLGIAFAGVGFVRGMQKAAGREQTKKSDANAQEDSSFWG